MANLTPVSTFDPVYQLETSDPVLGGAGGKANQQAQELANRTEWLKDQISSISGHNSQARTNVALAGKYGNTTGDYTALSAPASNTLRLTADGSFPFIYSASGGYDENGEITEIKKLTSNLERATSVLGNGNYLALVVHEIGDTPELFFCREEGFYATPFASTPSAITYDLWYNTATGVSSLNNFRTAGAWEPFCVVVVGRFVKAGGVISTVETFPYREPYYDEATQAGTVRTFAANATPRGGWLACTGGTVSRTLYRKLFTAVATTYGNGDGSTTFTLPDLRGEFIRGVDDSRGVDAGRVFGSSQTDLFKAHNHTFTDFAANTQTQVLADTGGLGGNINLPNAGTAYATNSVMNNTGGVETRPRNVAMRYYIKY